MRDINFDLLYSSTLIEGTNTLQDFHAWFSERVQSGKFEVDLAPLDSLKGWAMDSISGTYGHESGKFFTVNGLDVELEVNGDVKHWTQLIINQSEQGILGLIFLSLFVCPVTSGQTVTISTSAGVNILSINGTKINPTPTNRIIKEVNSQK